MKTKTIFLCLVFLINFFGFGNPSLGQDITSWGYQLQDIDMAEIKNSPFDLLVIDYSLDGTNDTSWSPQKIGDVTSSGKMVLSYLSIGEAEDYRYYWNPSWESSPPEWLVAENPDWKGNFKIKYWNDEWKNIVFDYLKIIINQGFSGAYLDIIDAYEYFLDQGVDDADLRMVQFVKEIGQTARALNPDFLIFPQNGEGLLQFQDYIDTIDGIGIEDLFYLEPGQKRDDQSLKERLNYLEMMPDGKPVLTVDYVQNTDEQMEVYNLANTYGFIPYTTVRSLDTLSLPIWMVSTVSSEQKLIFSLFPFISVIFYIAVKKHRLKHR